MTWDPVPWFIGGGAEHSPEVVRLMAYAATRGAEGIVGVADCKVSALGAPGGGFTVDPGAVVIANRSGGGTQQSYVARMATGETVMGIAPSGAQARSDLVVVRIKDPQYSPWQAPADRRIGPYLETFIISGVSASTTSAAALNLGYSAVALARIDLPANTSSVTNAMIKDLRKVANPRNQRDVEVLMPTGSQSSGGTNAWVAAANFPAVLDVPDYATTALAVVTVSGFLCYGAADVVGQIRLNFLGQASENVAVDMPGNTRNSYTVAGRFTIPAQYRGTKVPIGIDFMRLSTTGEMRVDSYCTLVADVTFQEKAE